MHILFLNGKINEINNLICEDSLNLLIEKNNNDLCPIDYINKNTLKVIIKQCISTNVNLNDNIIDLNNNVNYLYKKINNIENCFDKMSIILGCTSILYLLYGMCICNK